MTFLPIVARELRIGARKLSVRYLRLAVATLALGIGLFQVVFIPFFSRGGGAGGSGSFLFITGYAALICLLAGVFITADCLSEEKRAGTLGLLFLTDLRGHDVVLGKLASHALQLGYALLAIVPGAALPLLIGGVTGGEVWRVSLALVNLLFFSLAAGMLASALSREASRAMSAAGAILLGACVAWPILAPLGGGDWFLWLSPTQAWLQAREVWHVAAPERFWTALGLSHLAGWGLLALASWRLPHAWQDRPRATVVRATPPTVAGIPVAGPAKILRDRAQLDEDPLLWLIGGRMGMRSALWGLAILWSLFLLGCAVVAGENGVIVAIVTGWILLAGIKLLFATQACRFFAETRRQGAFEVLLAAPVTSSQLIAAQWRSLRRTFLPPLALMGGGGLIYAVGLLVWHARDMRPDEIGVGMLLGGVFGLMAVLMHVLDFFALGCLGMWLALTMRKPHHAAGATILFVMILPNVVFCYGPFISFILNIILIIIFAARLREDFRPRLLEQRAAA